MPAHFKLLIGCLAIIALGILGLHGPRRVEALEARILASVNSSLSASQSDWASAEISGQKITLFGAAPSEQAKNEAMKAAQSAIGPGGHVFGAVTVVNGAGLTLEISDPVMTDYFWQAVLKKGALTLSGYSPSPEAQALVEAQTKRLYSTISVKDQTKVRPHPHEGLWLVGSAASLRALAILENGTIENREDVFLLSGKAIDENIASEASQLMQVIAHPFQAGEIKIETRPTSPKPEASNVATVVNGGEAETVQSVIASAAVQLRTCQKNTDRLLAASPINFASNSAILRREQITTLTAVVERVSACAGARITVTGHTDASGAAQRNRQLSQERADIVAQAFASAGFRAQSLGKGEAQPIASNRTVRGRARNRRIEISIEQLDDLVREGNQ